MLHLPFKCLPTPEKLLVMSYDIWRTKACLTLLDMTILWSGFVPFVLILHVKVKLSAVVWCSIHWRDSFINKNKRLMMFLQDRPRLHRSAVFHIEFSSSLCRGWMHQWGAWPWVTWSHNLIRPWLRHSVLHICLSDVVDIICRYNCTHLVHHMPCWLTVVCYLQGMPDRMLCAVLEQFQLYFSRWYVRFVSVSVWYPCFIIVLGKNGSRANIMQSHYRSPVICVALKIQCDLCRRSVFLCQVNSLCFMYIICLIVFNDGCATLQYILSGSIQSCVLMSYCTATMNT